MPYPKLQQTDILSKDFPLTEQRTWQLWSNLQTTLHTLHRAYKGVIGVFMKHYCYSIPLLIYLNIPYCNGQLDVLQLISLMSSIEWESLPLVNTVSPTLTNFDQCPNNPTKTCFVTRRLLWSAISFNLQSPTSYFESMKLMDGLR